MNLQFISPLFLLGGLGVSLPILVHLLTRRHQTRIRFSALYLLEKAQKRSIRRAQPNRLLLLLFRCLGILFLSLALANPIFSFSGPEEFLPSKPSANVLILDNSYSMSHKGHGQNLYRHAVDTLLALVEKLPDNNRFSVVTTSQPLKPIVDWTGDRLQLTKLMELSKPSSDISHLGQAFHRAVELLEAAPDETKRIYVFTDMDENGWNPKEFENLDVPPNHISVTLVDYSDKRAEPNVAMVKHVEVTQEFLTDSHILRIRAHVSNLSDAPLKQQSIALVIDGKRQSEDLLDIAPRGRMDKEFTFPYLGQKPIQGYVEIQEDGLTLDNRRNFTFQPDHKIQVLIVDGDPRGVSHQNESFYVERALNPFSASGADIQPTVSTLSELPARNLDRYSVILLVNVRALPFDYERKLESFVKRGGGLFVALGDQVEAKFYNEKMGLLLPVTLRTLNQVNSDSKPFRLDTSVVDHPVLKGFNRKSLDAMGRIAFHTFYRVEARKDRTVRVPMKFTNGYPVLVESDHGKGKVLLYASSLDRDWNGFPIQPMFLPWVQRWVKYIAHSLESLSQNQLLVSTPLTLTETGNDAYVVSPGGIVTALARSETGASIFEDTDQPGAYALFQTPQKPSSENPTPNGPQQLNQLPDRAKPMGLFAVNVDTGESISKTLSLEEAQNLLPGMKVKIQPDSDFLKAAHPDSGIPLTTPLLFLLAAAFLIEGWMIRKE